MEVGGIPGEIVALALGLPLLSVAIFGFGLANVPLRCIGQNRGAGYSTRVLGYDGARGEFSMLAVACIFLPLLLPLPWLPLVGKVISGVLLASLALFHRLMPGVSHPGGPRAHRILREPQWPDKTWHAPAGWRCEVAEASHTATHKELRNGQKLTGEPAGRQTWHRESGARGKEKTGFNPSVNPNPDDSLWRAQRVAAWKAGGGKVPDGRWRPTTTLDSVRKALSWYEVLQSDDGHWAGDYGGPHFLLPGLVVVWCAAPRAPPRAPPRASQWVASRARRVPRYTGGAGRYITGGLETFLTASHREAMTHYLRVHQQ